MRLFLATAWGRAGGPPPAGFPDRPVDPVRRAAKPVGGSNGHLRDVDVAQASAEHTGDEAMHVHIGLDRVDALALLESSGSSLDDTCFDSRIHQELMRIRAIQCPYHIVCKLAIGKRASSLQNTGICWSGTSTATTVPPGASCPVHAFVHCAPAGR